MYSFFVAFLAIAQIYFTQNLFYDSNYELSSLLAVSVPFLIYTVIFIYSKEKHHEELEKSSFNTTLLDSCFKLINAYTHFYALKADYLAQVLELTSFTDFDMNLHFKGIMIHGISNMCVVIPLMLTIYFLTKDFKNIAIIFKGLIYFALIITFCYVVYNPVVGLWIYDKLNELVPVPYNVIFYNMLPDQDTRYRMIILTSIWIFDL